MFGLGARKAATEVATKRVGLSNLEREGFDALEQGTEQAPKKGFLGKAANVAGAVLNSPLLWAAPMVMPLIPGMNGDPSQQDQSQSMPSIDPVTQAQYQQMMAQQQMLGMTGGVR